MKNLSKKNKDVSTKRKNIRTKRKKIKSKKGGTNPEIVCTRHYVDSLLNTL